MNGIYLDLFDLPGNNFVQDNSEAIITTSILAGGLIGLIMIDSLPKEERNKIKEILLKSIEKKDDE